ncbi:hypothetical protein BDV34DRAFT_210400 [Aspergillus parasiticus]|uniref:Amine oxidase domain-containing protein n=1 Tax=Aspergillus parasiticus TaxID=5067 RepID=A0A5N6DY49_ASPPA|nr:hypothetical protein BDV34DRAFT_210400 [Aspergillus parasiticus]
MRVIVQAFASIAAMCLIGTVAGVAQSDSKHNPFSFNQLGGGSAGTYAAIRLRQLGKSFVVIEKQDRLGGHSNTYFGTTTGLPVPYGVMSILNKSVVTVTNQSENVDFATGEPIAIKLITIPNDDPEVRIAIENYKAQLAKCPFATKYKIEAIVPFIAGYNTGFGDSFLKLTLYMLKMFSLDVIYGIQHGFLSLPSHDNSVSYRAAEKKLGHDMLYKSRVFSAMRGLSEMDNSSYILAQTPSGQKPIHAKNILIAVSQTIENLMQLSLDRKGREIFAQFTGTYRYSSVIKNIYQIVQSIENRAYGTPYNLPILPGVYSLVNTSVPGLNWVLYGSSTFMRNEEVKKDIVDSVLLIRRPNITVTGPEIVAFKTHSPYELTVPVQAIQGGFYTGAALTAHESSHLGLY